MDTPINDNEPKLKVVFNMPCGKHIEPVEVLVNTPLSEVMQIRLLNPTHFNVYSIENGEDAIDPYKTMINNETSSPHIFFLLPYTQLNIEIPDVACMDAWEDLQNEMTWSHVNIPLDTLGENPSIHPLPFGRLLIHPSSPHEDSQDIHDDTYFFRFDFSGTKRLLTLNDVYIVSVNECICYHITLPIEDIPTNRFRYMNYDEATGIMYVILDDPPMELNNQVWMSIGASMKISGNRCYETLVI